MKMKGKSEGKIGANEFQINKKPFFLAKKKGTAKVFLIFADNIIMGRVAVAVAVAELDKCLPP